MHYGSLPKEQAIELYRRRNDLASFERGLETLNYRQDGERWITLGSDSEAGRKGTHVRIDGSGNITAGPDSLEGKNLDDFKLKSPKNKEHVEKQRQESLPAFDKHADEPIQQPRSTRGLSSPGVKHLDDGRKVGVTMLTPSEMAADPARFQYKITGIGEEGVTEELKEVARFRPEFAGQLLAWHDPEKNQTYVINGHHRYELAVRSGYEGEIPVFLIDAKNEQMARAMGAMANIAEGRGSAIDAAKFFRESELTPEDLRAEGISMKGRTADEGLALKDLSDNAFLMLVNDRLSEKRGLAVARNLKDHEQQDELFDQIRNAERKGHNVRDDAVEEMAKEYALASRKTEEQTDLFGTESVSRSLVVERGMLKAAIRRDLGAEAKAFTEVGRRGRAETLATAGNVIDEQENRRRAQSAQELLAAFDRESKYTGEINDAINRLAEQLADNPKRSKELEREAGKLIRASLLKTQQGGQEAPTGPPQGDSAVSGASGAQGNGAGQEIRYSRIAHAARRIKQLRYSRVAQAVASRKLVKYRRIAEKILYRKLKPAPNQKTIEWNEEDHPRDEEGKFSKTEAGSRGGQDSSSFTEVTTDQSSNINWQDKRKATDEYLKKSTKSRWFKRWFGDWENDPASASKVVDNDGEPAPTERINGEASKVKGKDGKPVVVYHGTPVGGWDKFDKSKLSRADSLLYGEGFYFTQNESVAEEYADNVQHVRLTKPELDKFADQVADAISYDQDFVVQEWPASHPANRSYGESRLVIAKKSDEPANVDGSGSSWITLAMTDSGGRWEMANEIKVTQDRFFERNGLHKVRAVLDKYTPPREVKQVYLNIRNPLDVENDHIAVENIPDDSPLLDSSKFGNDIREYRDLVKRQTEKIEAARAKEKDIVENMLRANYGWTDGLVKELRLRAWFIDGEEGWWAQQAAHAQMDAENAESLIKHEKRRMTYQNLKKDYNKSTLTELIKAAGYDGITHTGGQIMGSKEHRVWIAFEPNQIKSVENVGTFDPENESINYQAGWVESEHPRDSDGQFTVAEKVKAAVSKKSAGKKPSTTALVHGLAQLPMAKLRSLQSKVASGRFKNYDEQQRLEQLMHAAIDLRAFGKPDKNKAAASEHVEKLLEPLGLRKSPKQNKVSDNLKKWLGNSVVVDKNGSPQRVFHGGGREAGEFSVPKNGIRMYGDGLYFSDSPELASDYAERSGDGGNVAAAYLKLENPFVLDMQPGEFSQNGWRRSGFPESMVWANKSEALTAELKSRGHDGVVVNHPNGRREFIVFESNQIKSATGNSGAFDANNPDVRYSRIAQAIQYAKRWVESDHPRDDDGKFVETDKHTGKRPDGKPIWNRQNEGLRNEAMQAANQAGAKVPISWVSRLPDSAQILLSDKKIHDPKTGAMKEAQYNRIPEALRDTPKELRPALVAALKKRINFTFHDYVDDSLRDIESSGSEKSDAGKIPRADMPQIAGHDKQEFLDWIKSKYDVTAKPRMAKVRDLKPSQSDWSQDKVDAMVETMRRDGKLPGTAVIASNDDYILDGHHRYYAQNEVDPDSEFPIVRVNASIDELLRWADKFPKSFKAGTDEKPGARDYGDKIKTLDDIPVDHAQPWNATQKAWVDQTWKLHHVGGASVWAAKAAAKLLHANLTEQAWRDGKKLPKHALETYPGLSAPFADDDAPSKQQKQLFGERQKSLFHRIASAVQHRYAKAYTMECFDNFCETKGTKDYAAQWNEQLHPRDEDGKFATANRIRSAVEKKRGAEANGGAPPAPAQQAPAPKPQSPASKVTTDFSAIHQQYPPLNPNGIDTQSKYKDPKTGQYTPERQKLHESIINKILEGVTPSANPTFYMMGGGTAAGKSTAMNSGMLNLSKNAAHFDPDGIKGMLPEYQAQLEGKDNSAAGYNHEESSDITNMAIDRASQMGLDGIVDVTGDSGIDKLRDKVNSWRANGHKVVANYCTVPTDMAVERSMARAAKTGRHVEENVIRGIHAGVSQVVPQAISEGLYDEFTLWDTTSNKPFKVASAKGNQLQVENQRFWQTFLDKGKV